MKKEMHEDRNLIIRFLEGNLPEDEAQGVQLRQERDPDFRTLLMHMRTLQEALRSGKPDSFAPFFSERVLNRLAPSLRMDPAETLYESLRWLFARTAVAGLAFAGILATYNAVQYQGLGVASSFLEALFGLPSASLFDALTYTPM